MSELQEVFAIEAEARRVTRRLTLIEVREKMLDLERNGPTGASLWRDLEDWLREETPA
jgi:hypothetical protein